MIRDDRNFPWCPALWLGICFGIGVQLQASSSVSLHAWAAFTLVSALALVIPWLRMQRGMVDAIPLLTALVMAVVAVSAGGMRGAMNAFVPANSIVHLVPILDGNDVMVDGRVVSLVENRTTGARMVVSVDSIIGAIHPVAARGRLQVFFDEPEVDFERGWRVRLAARLAETPGRRNPADFDYGLFLRRNGVSGILYAETRATTVLDMRRMWFTRSVDASRSFVRRVIQTHVSSGGGRIVLQALLLGDRSGLSPEENEQLARSGLMHLLAVSGLHVLLVGMVLYRLLRPMLLRIGLTWKSAEWTRSIVTLAVLSFYMVLTGSTPSVVRAVVMEALFIGSTITQRPVQSLNTLGAAGLIILLIQPNQLFAAGFQLSFSAVGAIILYGTLLRRAESATRAMPRALGYVTNSVMVSLAATLGTLPVLLYHFGRESIAGLVLNIPAIPATFGVLASGLLLIITYPVSHFAAGAFGASADILANSVLYMARIGDQWSPVALIEQQVRDGWWIAAIVAGTLLIGFLHHKRLRWRTMILLLCFVSIAVWTRPSDRGLMDIVFFDVGQGDAALVRTPSGHTILIDAGPRNHLVDMGERVLKPNLDYFGVKRLDAVVITHPHSDHLGGLPHLLRTMPIAVLYDNGAEYDSNLYSEVRHLMDSLSIDHRVLSAGDVVELDETVHMKVLAPVQDLATSVNDASVVLRITQGDVSLLMLGDAEAQSEALLSRYYRTLLPSTLIKAGHHGSSTSSTTGFVFDSRLSDKDGLVVVSVAERNRYRHPSKEVLNRWEGTGRSVHLTSESGALWFRSDGKALRRVNWK